VFAEPEQAALDSIVFVGLATAMHFVALNRGAAGTEPTVAITSEQTPAQSCCGR